MLDSLYTILIEPYSFIFMQNALAVSSVVGLTCGIFSCFLILKGWSLIGDATSHAILPGIAITYILNIPMIFGAFIASLFCVLLSGFVKNNSRLKEDTVLGIIFSGMFALGIILISQIESDIHLMHILFGNILGITSSDLILSTIISLFCLLILIIKRKDLTLYCFDPIHSHIINISPKQNYLLLLSLLSLCIVAAIKSSGIILVVAMLILPGAISFLLTKSINKMFFISSITSLTSSFFGLAISYNFDASSSACIVLTQSFFFLLVFIKNKVLS